MELINLNFATKVPTPSKPVFPGGVIVTNNSSRVYGIALFGIDKFDVE